MGDYLDCGAGGTGMHSIAVAINKGITKQDRIRERELFRFYRPKHATLEHQDSVGSSTLSSAPSPPSSPPHTVEDGESSPIGNNDVTLAALTQLVALRLGVHRAMINVIGREIQYTLVDATKTMDLVSQTTSQEEGDGAWVGSGGSMPKSISLCENVVALPTDVLEHPFLVVPDLSKHPQFKSRPYVCGPPGYRFYAGTPLRTARGVVIGALCTFAFEPRDISETDKAYMATIAETIMQHLEMRRAAAERDKVTRMSRGLNAFIEGRTSQYINTSGSKPALDGSTRPIPSLRVPSTRRASGDAMDTDPPQDADTRENQHASTRPETQDQATRQTGGADKPEHAANQTRASSGQAADDVRDKSTDSEDPGIEEQFQTTLSRAACLLGEALGLANGGGGVTFYDTMARIDTVGSNPSGRASPTGSDDLEDWGSMSDEANTPGAFEGVSDSEEAKAGVLGSSVDPRLREQHEQQHFSSQVPHSGTAPFLNFSSRMVSKFIRRYPSGLVWEFDEHGVIPNHDEGVMPLRTPAAVDPMLMRQTAAEREARQRVEAEYLMRIFPGVRSLVFVPLWDANASRHYAACFAWTTNALGRFSIDVELSFITAFGNSISAEISRQATVDADQRKSDFIGSVSHELRSPLHGVLASSEFLADTSLDSFQATLVNTIDSCGRTLLDTINHVLDFSKINSLRRSWKRSKGQQQHQQQRQQQRSIDDGSQASNDHHHNNGDGAASKMSHAMDASGQSGEEATALQNSGIMSILGSTDVAAITEEVVDSIYAGKIYAKAFSPADITDFNASISQRRSSELPRWDSEDQMGAAASSSAATGGRHGVQVLLDIAPGDYNFVTQPGAIRRIVMNIFGNALKYTDKGSIVVRLCQQPSTGPSSSSEPSSNGNRDKNGTSETNKDDCNDNNNTHATTTNESSKSKIILTIKDTGKGISTGYLRTRLYTPFAQENDLAPGTGLGLSIVRNIVTMLRGDINIRSKVGRGTEVRITIPNLSRPAAIHAGRNGSISASSIVSNGERGDAATAAAGSSTSRNEPVRSTLLDFAYLHERREKIVVGLYGFSAELGSILQETERIIRRYLSEWCRVRSVVDFKAGVQADMIIVDERLLKQFEYSGLATPTDNIIVLCKNPAPLQTPRMTDSHHYFLLKPFGPYKLARTIRKCIERSSDLRRRRRRLSRSRSRTSRGSSTEAASGNNHNNHNNNNNYNNNDSSNNQPTYFPPALDMSVPRVEAEPSIRIGAGSQNAGMAVTEKRALSEDSQTQTQLRPTRPRLSSLSPRSSPASSVNGADNGDDDDDRDGAGSRRRRRWEDAKYEVAVTDGGTPTPERRSSPRLQPAATTTTTTNRPTPLPPTTTQSTQSTATAQSTTAQSTTTATATGMATGTSENTQRAPRILVVDDNKTNLMLLQTFLKKKRGYASDSAMDGGMAVREATNNKYDIIFMDISMPVLNGFEATREIRRHEDMLRKQFRRESLGTPRSRPTSRVWHGHHQLGAGSGGGGAGAGAGAGAGGGGVAMTPSHSQQQHLLLPQPLINNGQHDHDGRPHGGDGAGVGTNSTVQNDAQRASKTASDDAQSRPSKPVTPPNGSEDEIDRGEGNARHGAQQQQQQQQQQKSSQKLHNQQSHSHSHSHSQHQHHQLQQQQLKPAFIIALTGLASGRDQSEAFTSGVDLYMTKPVSFKEVGRLLDNWMTNGGLMPSDS